MSRKSENRRPVDVLGGENGKRAETDKNDNAEVVENDGAELCVDGVKCAKHDVFTVAKRSQIMSKVRSTGNASTELKLIAEFKERKIIGWRRKSKIFGRPDFLFPKLRVAVFVDGCFWHGHDCRNTKPKDNAEYWRAKIERNQRRDRAATERLTELGYLVVRIWECDFQKKNRERLNEKLTPIVEAFERWKTASTETE